MSVSPSLLLSRQAAACLRRVAGVSVLCALLAARGGEVPADIVRLEELVAAAAPDARVALLTRLAHALEPVDLPLALAAAERACELAPDDQRELPALVELAEIHRRRGDYPRALAQSLDGLARAKRLGDERLQAEFLLVAGRTYWSRADFTESVEALLQQLGLAERLGDDRLLALGYSGLGSTYDRLGQREEAGRRHARALEHAQRCGDGTVLSLVQNHLGNYHQARREYSRAAGFYRQALDLRRALGNDRGVADTLTNLANLAEAEGDVAGALARHREALAVYERVGVPRNLALTHRRIATLLRRHGRTDEALAHLQAGLVLAEKLGSQTVTASLQQELARTHEAHGDYQAALLAERRLAAANDAALDQRTRERIAELQARYDAEKRDNEIERLKRDRALQEEEMRRRRFQFAAVGAGLLLGLVSIAAVAVVLRLRLHSERRVLAATEEARAAAEEAAQLKTRLLQMASHDLKAPITLVRTAAAGLRQHAHDPVRVARLAAAIHADSARMGGLVHEFLDHAALEAGRLELRLEPVDLAALARAAVESFEGLAATKQQALGVAAPGVALPRAQADAARLHQILENLLSNALRFTPAGGSVQVAVGEVDGRVFLEVRDSGPGLSPEDFARLYTPFQPLSAAPTGGERSHGLGLYITRELLARQAGTLEVESQPGVGATFRLVLPCAA